ncbi:site-specific integrase [Nitrosomonas sp. HPC101]|uniref:site-specific integrase n=1 Tax=Nitrosomonas sp. HPC101 TaxID=1658667 RepID=UPI00137084FF|nr:site-specific integrase [Nitrosomonas sp. HPC101]MXS85453.1 site-specific integrase [Nitrosomonas sp. HPC101]
MVIQIPKAYDLLAAQSISVKGLSDFDRSNIIVSAVVDMDGNNHVLSRFGDPVWDFRPYFEQSNVADGQKYILWPDDCPQAMVDDCKAVLYAWFKRGLPHSKPPIAMGVCQAAIASAIPTMRWLTTLNIRKFDQVKPIHIANYVHYTQSRLTRNAQSVYDSLRILDFLWVFRNETSSPLAMCPWGESSLWRICGLAKQVGGQFGRTETGKTPIIPPDVQAKIFNHCEQILASAPKLLNKRDAGKLGHRNPALIRIRDAALYILSITSGMRNEEVIGIETGSWRSEMCDGVEYHWVATTEHKTGKGKVEFLIPELTVKVLDMMSHYAKPLQEELSREIEELMRNSELRGFKERMLRLAKAKRDVNKLFLCTSMSGQSEASGYHVDALSNGASKISFRRLAKAAGTDWLLAPHQCRRTYARNIVESRMGRASLVFLKWQFKHSSISMTQLYASNPIQDTLLFNDILDEMTEFKVDLIESWLSEQPLSGGAGRKIKKARIIALENRKALLAETASQVHIRATGHGWCLAQEKGCGGAGLYEATRCVGCKNGVIDKSFTEIWKGIYEQQTELLAIDDAGPAVKQRAERDVKWARQVMVELGVLSKQQVS